MELREINKQTAAINKPLTKPKFMKYHYEKLMSHNPTVMGEFTNSIGQVITFIEHPFEGLDLPIICVCHELKLAASSDFYGTSDMTAEHGEYEPSFVDGQLFIGDFSI